MISHNYLIGSTCWLAPPVSIPNIRPFNISGMRFWADHRLNYIQNSAPTCSGLKLVSISFTLRDQAEHARALNHGLDFREAEVGDL